MFRVQISEKRHKKKNKNIYIDIDLKIKCVVLKNLNALVLTTFIFQFFDKISRVLMASNPTKASISLAEMCAKASHK